MKKEEKKNIRCATVTKVNRLPLLGVKMTTER